MTASGYRSPVLFADIDEQPTEELPADETEADGIMTNIKVKEVVDSYLHEVLMCSGHGMHGATSQAALQQLYHIP